MIDRHKRRASEATKAKPETNRPTAQVETPLGRVQRSRQCVQQLAKRFWVILVAFLTLLGGWVLVKPVVHVEPYVQLNPDFPFSERFRVSNDGNFAINDTSFSCHVLRTVSSTPDGSAIIGRNLDVTRLSYVKAMEAGASTTIDCPVDNLVNFGNAQVPRYYQAEMEFIIQFRPSWYLWKKEVRIKFIGQLDSENKVHWTY